MVPGAAEHAVGFATIADVHRVDAALEHLTAATSDATAPRPVISVVGAGYAGVELAATVAERMAGASAVHLLSPTGGVMPVRRPRGPALRGGARAAETQATAHSSHALLTPGLLYFLLPTLSQGQCCHARLRPKIKLSLFAIGAAAWRTWSVATVLWRAPSASSLAQVSCLW